MKKIVFCTLTMTLCVLFGLISIALAAPPSSQVTVVNTASNPVPVKSPLTAQIYEDVGLTLANTPGNDMASTPPIDISAYSHIRIYVQLASGANINVSFGIYDDSSHGYGLDSFTLTAGTETRVYDTPGKKLVINLNAPPTVTPNSVNIIVYGR